MLFCRSMCLVFSLFAFNAFADENVLVAIDSKNIPSLDRYMSSGDLAVAIAKVPDGLSINYARSDKLSHLQVGSGLTLLGASGQAVLDQPLASMISEQASTQLGTTAGVSNLDRIEALLIVRSGLRGGGENQWPGGGGGNIPLIGIPPPLPPSGGDAQLVAPSGTFSDLIQLQSKGLLDNRSIEVLELVK